MFKIIMDSACDLPLHLIEDEKIDLIPLHITVDNHTIDDTKSLTELEQFKQELSAGHNGQTAQANVGEFVTIFTKWAQQSVPILYIGFSSGMSGTLSSALQAKDIVLEEYPNAEIEIIDTLAACGAIGMMVMDAIDQRSNGANVHEVAKLLENTKLHYHHLFTISNLNYLVLGGRLSRSSAMIGQLLKVQPILTINNDGKIEVIRKTRSMKKSLQSMADEALETVTSIAHPEIIIASSDKKEVGEQLKQDVLKNRPDANVTILPLGMTLVAHTGPNCTAIFFKGETDRQI
ncbi:DegV family protein [Paucilactobacillus suebicus]|uniref:DegV family protein n=1 Tax=Paucilactobacillus suebicus DSM 5007 = KCTC 3549 TaxID=1423807 RepID=A0A0R1W5T2_9LACO|nr:DegV family protein [Paucilactobacillus suebicus]KRM12805.1 DegV family protein [Paucilactobacillus suebicus DSM 5007 = KCTC 3549]